VKIFILLLGLLFSLGAVAEPSADEWQDTSLSDETIKKIQESRYEYKKCVGSQIQKPDYLKMDTRKATEEITKQCEPTLAKIREVYLAEKLPGVIADRHLRQIRTQTTRKVLQNLMYEQASRSAGTP
jgi:hypothetical protein